MSAPCDLRVIPSQNQLFPEECILQAIKLGYKTVAVDQSIINDPDPKKKTKETVTKIVEPVSFRSKLQKVDSDPKIQILSRITIECTGKGNISKTLKPQLDQFDLIAGRPLDGNALERLVEEDIDIISLDAEYKKSYHIKKELIKAAFRRGISFEINYGPCVADSTAREHTIELAQELLVFSKGKVQFVRGPYDVVNLAVLFGMTTGVAKLTVTQNCINAIKHCKLRNSIAGSMDIQKVDNNKPQCAEQINKQPARQEPQGNKRPAGQQQSRKKKKFKSGKGQQN